MAPKVALRVVSINFFKTGVHFSRHFLPLNDSKRGFLWGTCFLKTKQGFKREKEGSCSVVFVEIF